MWIDPVLQRGSHRRGRQATAASRNFNPFIFEYIRLLIFVIADHISIVVAVHFRPAFAHERAVLLGTRDVIDTERMKMVAAPWRLYWPNGTPLTHDECPTALVLKQNRQITGA